MPIVWGFFWGGAAQVIAGIIDGRRGDIFGFTAFLSYGFFWIGMGFSFLLQWIGLITLDGPGLAWTFIAWGIFTVYMTVASFRTSRVLVFVFTTLIAVFFMLAAHFFGALPVAVPGVLGLFTGGAAVYLSAAIIINEKYERQVLPIFSLSK